mmetsp:Transcript_13975/g.24504  ORF Transcript_13975/g.24504 Transcript_13975/m.24504 type:complete len:628 (-) Transcript_13975:180-2063(-)
MRGKIICVNLLCLTIISVFVRPGSLKSLFDMRSLEGTSLQSVVALARATALAASGPPAATATIDSLSKSGGNLRKSISDPGRGGERSADNGDIAGAGAGGSGYTGEEMPGSGLQQTVVTQTVVTQTVVTNLEVQDNHVHSEAKTALPNAASVVTDVDNQAKHAAGKVSLAPANAAPTDAAPTAITDLDEQPNQADSKDNNGNTPVDEDNWARFKKANIPQSMDNDGNSDDDNNDKGNGIKSVASTTADTLTKTTPTTTTSLPYFNASDWDQFVKWKQRVPFEGNKPPRILIYTWCTEDTFVKFQNEVYWKSCYGHLHGYDVVFSDKKNFSGMAEYKGPGIGQLSDWYSEENMWALWSDIQPYLKSGKYDYVFMMGADVLIQGAWMHWPVWAWDRGHDVTVMDQHHFPFRWSYGLNENDVLFKATDFTLQFINEVFEFRKGFHLQGDNGPYMEGILRTLGRIAESEGREGYHQECYPLVQIDKPSVLSFSSGWWERRNDQFDTCFFKQLNRMTGSYGYRNSKGIGFYPTFIGFDGKAVLPKEFLPGTSAPYVPPEHVHYPLLPLGPWANCWSSVRTFWNKPWMNCFAYHWNGPKDPSKHGTVSGGTCPDPTFDWANNPYNPANRGKKN